MTKSLRQNFWGKNVFPENPDQSCTTSYEFLVPFQNLGKTNDTISRKRPNRRKDGARANLK